MSLGPLTRLRIVDIVVGLMMGGVLAVALFPKLGWLALLLVPLSPLIWVNSGRSFENLERQTQKKITVSLDLDPHPDDEDPKGGAA